KQIGITLKKFGEAASLSEGMLSRFETGCNELSPESWARVLQTMSRFVQHNAAGNLKWSTSKRVAGIVKARMTAAKLGQAVSQSLNSPTFAERLEGYVMMEPATTLEEANERIAEVLEMCGQVDVSLKAARKEIQFWREFADKYDQIRDLL